MQTKLRYKEFGSTLLECIPWTAPSTHSPLQSSALEREVSSTTWRRDRLYLCLSRGIGSLQRTVLETKTLETLLADIGCGPPLVFSGRISQHWYCKRPPLAFSTPSVRIS